MNYLCDNMYSYYFYKKHYRNVREFSVIQLMDYA